MVMARSLSWITDESWPSDEGWPYPDSDADHFAIEEPPDLAAEADDDLIALHLSASRLFAELAPLERRVLGARYGLDGRPARTMREIQRELRLPRDDLRDALGGGLTKLRTRYPG
jgi:DNA-directed RNA polymerase sigma subunit (sigma70/sigma32)